MKFYLMLLMFVTLFSLSLHAEETKKVQINDEINSYVAFDKLNENMYTVDNEDFILGLGVKIKSSEKLDFIFVYEGDVISYIHDGALSYKLNYKF